jgi:hypothetical protein
VLVMLRICVDQIQRAEFRTKKGALNPPMLYSLIHIFGYKINNCQHTKVTQYQHGFINFAKKIAHDFNKVFIKKHLNLRDIDQTKMNNLSINNNNGV